MNTKFDIVQEHDLTNFKKQVQKRLDEGWILHGSSKVFPDPTYKAAANGSQICYVQALVKEEKGKAHTSDKDSGSDPFDEF
ncbi:MAG: DUF1737 domain-containing protein [Flavisolibacter sp.]|nr:DUF1737 domain-containing protein [Flavisolibacter sp.]